MTLFGALKTVHVLCAILSISGFTLRVYWMYTGNKFLQRRLAKTLPHLVDTLLLGSAVGMLLVWQASPFSLAWLSTKVFVLLLYIGLGMMALRFGETRTARLLYGLLALVAAGYIVSVAIAKSPWGLFA